jgi:hypothetical protein
LIKALGKTGLAGVFGGQMQQTDIDPGFAGFQVRVQNFPGAAEGGAREQVLAEDGVAEGLGFADQRADQVVVIDDTGAAGL